MNQDLEELKRLLYAACQSMLTTKIAGLQSNLRGFQDAANAETKSSAGDKYETGRAMMHLEKEKVAHALNEVLKQKKVMDQLSDQVMAEAQLGALVRTDKGCFYLSVSLGKVTCHGQDVFCLSPVSPLGKMLLGATSGAQLTFNRMTYHIDEVA